MRNAVIAEASFNQIQYFEQIESLKVSPIITVDLLAGAIDVCSAERAVNELVRRHESLRTCFVREDGVVKQMIYEFMENTTVRDLRTSESYSEVDKNVENLLNEKKKEVHDVENLPLAVFVLTGAVDGISQLYAFVNHIICDAWSADVMKREVNYLYEAYVENTDPVLPPLQYQLIDYCRKQNSWINSNLPALQSFWKNRLGHLEPRFDPSIFYRGYLLRKTWDHDASFQKKSSFDAFIKANSENRVSNYTTRMDHRSFVMLNEISRRNSNMLSIVMYASFAILLHIYLRDPQVLIASPVADRDLPYKRDLIGNLMGGAYLSLDMHEDMTCGEVIALVSESLISAVENIIFDHRVLDIDESKVRPRCDFYVNFLRVNGNLKKDVSTYEKKHTKGDYIGLYYILNCVVEEYSDAVLMHWKYGDFMFSSKLIEDLSSCHAEIIDGMWRDNNMKVESLKHSLLNRSLRKTLFERKS